MMADYEKKVTAGGAGYCVESGVCAFRETWIVAKTQSGI